jgi:4-hydroxy-tetrahydrodipicolinate reductase
MAIKILVNGAFGKMGQEACNAINECPAFSLVAKLGSKDSLEQAIQIHQPEVVLDLTTAHVVYDNTRIIIENNVHPVIGTTGLTAQQIDQFQEICGNKQLGALIVPNFSIGAILMMKFAEQAASYFPDVEIIELHHNKKQDAPSGTAIKTAQLIAKNRKEIPNHIIEKEILPGARGAKQNEIPIHSVRLPGLVAHQKVIFGGNSETLTIAHDTINRQCFMPGIILACKKVLELDHLVYGLENIL